MKVKHEKPKKKFKPKNLFFVFKKPAFLPALVQSEAYISPDAAGDECRQSARRSDAGDHCLQRLVGVLANELVALAHLAQQRSDRQLQILATTRTL